MEFHIEKLWIRNITLTTGLVNTTDFYTDVIKNGGVEKIESY
ncbi:Threonine dehydrogenase [Geobacillus proteiniphilus]|uniref:Threonine dehydrogenase n=1 Tax=Geobacillus proteiniphilus TaxID=860353 RepID=A0A1Q5T2Y1_9BACL|nr:Threonine dehydrogenase [Geobacillus proteiniphilus]